jgi:hypothetical protein
MAHGHSTSLCLCQGGKKREGTGNDTKNRQSALHVGTHWPKSRAHMLRAPVSFNRLPPLLLLVMMRLKVKGFQALVRALRDPLRFPFRGGLCYNLRAVVRPANRPPALASSPSASVREQEARTAPSEPARRGGAVQFEDASRFCPVCSQRLESRRCKLVCLVCGYYMSCADYY